jgi:hypothetical protein
VARSTVSGLAITINTADDELAGHTSKNAGTAAVPYVNPISVRKIPSRGTVEMLRAAKMFSPESNENFRLKRINRPEQCHSSDFSLLA